MADKLKATAMAMKAAAKLSKNKSETVKVCVRVRPLSSKEKQDGREIATEPNTDRGEIRVRNPRADASEPPKVFTFDATFGPTVKQRHVYDTCGAGIVDNVMQGFNGTVFAYGQTGAGKSFTMTGAQEPPELQGIIPNSFTHIFSHVAAVEGSQYLVRASYLEIYNEEIRDLLSKDPNNRLELKESTDSGVYVKDLTSFVVKSAAEIDGVMNAGNKNRSVGATLMNQTSSRSHSIFTIIVECGSKGADGEDHICVGKLNMVDLAGSERQSKTGATGDRLKEATKINLSLSALGNVISALVDGKSSHIPYRDSKLTRLLQDSLGGNTKTVMIANCGPADYNYDETLTTLRYANRAKNIKNKPKINEDPKDAMLREFQDEILRLRAQLANTSEGGGGGAPGKGLPAMHLADGKAVPAGATVQIEKEVQEKVVVEEKVVVKREGVTEEALKEMQDKALAEKKAMKEKAQREVKEMMRNQAKTQEDRDRARAELESEREEALRIEEEKTKVEEKLRAMEEKLIQGGKLMDKAARQEIELRRANVEIEERKRQEQQLQRELQQKEETELAVEQQYTSLQEEVDVKTKKLKKLWTKFQEATTEITDLQGEFQQEKEDMLDTIRQLTRQITLKQKIVDMFLPTDTAQQLQGRAQLDERGQWVLRPLSMDPTSSFPSRPVAFEVLRRPESEYARSRKAYDANPRYKYDNIIHLELDTPDRTTQDYQGPAMMQRVQEALSAALEGDEEDIHFEGPDTLPDFNKEAAPVKKERDPDKKKSRPKSGRRRKEEKTDRKSRPKSGRRREKSSSSSSTRAEADDRDRDAGRDRDTSAGRDRAPASSSRQAFAVDSDEDHAREAKRGDRERTEYQRGGAGGGGGSRRNAFGSDDDMEEEESEMIGGRDVNAERERMARKQEMDKELERQHVHYRDRGKERDGPPVAVRGAW